MSHRVGVCSSCEANYKVPADFAADKAKCKECGGVVEIGAVVEDPPPPPVPAKPVRKAEPKLEEHVPSGKKGEGQSMMEKLLTQRQEERKAQSAKVQTTASEVKEEAAPKAPVAARKTTSSGDGPPKAKAGSRRGAPSRSSRPSRSRRRRDAEDDDEEEGEETTGRHSRKKKKSLVPLICTLLLLVGCAIGGGIYMLKDAVEEAIDIVEEEMAKAEAVIEADIATAPEDIFEDPPEEDATAMESEEDGAEEEVTKPKPTSTPKLKDPMSIDLESLADFGPAPGCSDERWASLQEDAALRIDPGAGAAGGRAGKRLEEAGRIAIPAIINVFKTVDMGSEVGYQDGDLFSKHLEKIYNGKNFGWKRSIEPNDHWYNRRVVELYWKNWDKYQHDEPGWLRFTGLDKEGVKPSGSAEDELSTDELDALDDI